MSRYRTIQYAFDYETGQIWSRVDGEVAVPILDFENMTPENKFKMNYFLEKVSVFEALPNAPQLKWTKKIPIEIKNMHRKFWGMTPLKN
jgi:hypothetical protein